jgi:Carboxypeptidase regulatory-like domain
MTNRTTPKLKSEVVVLGPCIVAMFPFAFSVIKSGAKGVCRRPVANLTVFPVAALGLALWIALPGRAQLTPSAILGTVRDSSGAVLPGVRVQIRNVATNQVSTATTNGSGFYQVAPLAPGTYTVSGEKSGFQRKVITSVILSMSQEQRIDIVLPLGSLEQRVTVVGTSPLLDTTTAEGSQVIPNQAVVDLPLNGRDYLDLAKLAPGATMSQAASWTQPNTPYPVAINGQRAESVLYLYEGMYDKERFFDEPIFIPSIDAIDQFQVKENNYSAEYGTTGAGIVSAMIKSGTNQYHGDVYEFLRNDALDARSFFEPVNEAERYNQFGGTIGGPIQHNRTFFFFSTEFDRFDTPTVSYSRVPTPAERNGDFSNLLAQGVQIYNPMTFNSLTGTKQPFPGDIIPTNMINSTAAKFLPYWPQPTFPVNADNQNLFASLANVDNAAQYIGRVDHIFSNRFRLSGSFTASRGTDVTPGPWSSMFGNTVADNPNVATVTFTQTYSPELVNETEFGLTEGRLATTIPESNSNWYGHFGFTGGATTPPSFYQFPAISILNYTSLGSYPSPNWYRDNEYQLTDFLTYVNGTHTLEVGGQWNYFRSNSFLSFNNDGDTFEGDFSGNGFADFLLGYPSSEQQVTPIPQLGTIQPFEPRMSFVGTYAQDSWRVTPRFTANLGIRFEMLQAPDDANGRVVVGFDPSTGDIEYPEDTPLPSDLRAPTDGWEVVNRNSFFPTHYFALPRVGVAWRPTFSSNTVIRSGYGIFTVQPAYDVYSESFLSAPFQIFQLTTLDTAGLPPTTIGNLGTAVYNPSDASALSFRGLTPPGFTDAYVQDWDFDIQHQLKFGILADIDYVGNKATHLDWNTKFDTAPAGPDGEDQDARPYPDQNQGREVFSDANSVYNGLQLKAEKRYPTHGLYFLADFTWSRGLNNSDGTSFANTPDDENFCTYELLAGYQHSCWAPVPDDVNKNFSLSAVYDLPFGNNLTSRLSRTLLGGWRTAGILSWRTGFPLTTLMAANILNNGYTDTPMVIGGCNPNLGSSATLSEWFNVSCFKSPAPYQYGNAAPRDVRGPGYRDLDFSLTKKFPISEQRWVEFRAEAFNALNWPDFALPNNVIDSATPGVITSTVNQGRVIQLALKLYF